MLAKASALLPARGQDKREGQGREGGGHRTGKDVKVQMDRGLSESPLSALVPGMVSGALTGSVPEGHPQHRLVYILTAQEQLLTGSPHSLGSAH